MKEPFKVLLSALQFHKGNYSLVIYKILKTNVNVCFTLSHHLENWFTVETIDCRSLCTLSPSKSPVCISSQYPTYTTLLHPAFSIKESPNGQNFPLVISVPRGIPQSHNIAL